jgi:hypothetical protein
VPYQAGSYETEQYEIQNGKVIAISVYGDHLVDDACKGTDSVANKFGGDEKGYDYGRKLVTTDASDYATATESNKFCFGPVSGKTSADSFETSGNYRYATTYKGF